MRAAASPDPAVAAHLARVALRNVATEYPYHRGHLVRERADVRAPREQHPLFWGSYDWHSCVHMHADVAEARASD